MSLLPKVVTVECIPLKAYICFNTRVLGRSGMAGDVQAIVVQEHFFYIKEQANVF